MIPLNLWLELIRNNNSIIKLNVVHYFVQDTEFIKVLVFNIKIELGILFISKVILVFEKVGYELKLLGEEHNTGKIFYLNKPTDESILNYIIDSKKLYFEIRNFDNNKIEDETSMEYYLESINYSDILITDICNTNLDIFLKNSDVKSININYFSQEEIPFKFSFDIRSIQNMFIVFDHYFVISEERLILGDFDNDY
ncbi:hypothetical protein [Carp edema virus]|nr:hypothetical protein [Carp edema virus]